jgi:hypothetical protein
MDQEGEQEGSWARLDRDGRKVFTGGVTPLFSIGYRNGLGPRAFQGQGPQPGRGNKPSQAQMVLGRGRNKVGSPYPVHLTSGLGKAGKLLKPGEVLSVSLPAPPLGIPTPNVSPTLIAFLPLRVHDREQARDPTR